jgi:hypothetical protein
LPLTGNERECRSPLLGRGSWWQAEGISTFIEKGDEKEGAGLEESPPTSFH